MTQKQKLLSELGFCNIPQQLEDAKKIKTYEMARMKEKAIKRAADKIKLFKS